MWCSVLDKTSMRTQGNINHPYGATHYKMLMLLPLKCIQIYAD